MIMPSMSRPRSLWSRNTWNLSACRRDKIWMAYKRTPPREASICIGLAKDLDSSQSRRANNSQTMTKLPSCPSTRGLWDHKAQRYPRGPGHAENKSTLSGQGERASQKNTQESRLVSCVEGSSDTGMSLWRRPIQGTYPALRSRSRSTRTSKSMACGDSEADDQGSHGGLWLTFGASKSYSFWNAFLEDSASRLL